METVGINTESTKSTNSNISSENGNTKSDTPITENTKSTNTNLSSENGNTNSDTPITEMNLTGKFKVS